MFRIMLVIVSIEYLATFIFLFKWRRNTRNKVVQLFEKHAGTPLGDMFRHALDYMDS